LSRWDRAIAEHHAVVADAVTLIGSLPLDVWARPLGERRWTYAAMSLHIGQAYEFCRDAALHGDEMRLRVSPIVAWVARHTLLPLSLATQRFPRGVGAPREVRPDEAFALKITPAECATRLTAFAGEAVGALHAAPARLRIKHAYFGPIPPISALRVLSAHTRHHVAGIRLALA
jgi:hypothetical protein